MYTAEEILQRMLQMTDPGYDTSPGGFIYDSQAPVSEELAAYHTRIENMNDTHFVDTCYGTNLDRYVKDYGMERKQAEKAVGECTFYGSNGSVIKIGDRVADDTGLIFYVIKEGTIEGTEITLPIECASATAKGNLEAGKICQMPVTIRGITKVENKEATHGGVSRETDTELRERFYNRMDFKNVPGSAPWYESETEAVDGVPNGGAKCLSEEPHGPGTVTIVIVNEDFGEADETLMQKVKEHFDPPIVGHKLYVESAETIPINISVKVTMRAGYDKEEAKTAFSGKASEYFKTFKTDGGVLILNYIGNLLYENDVPGVFDYTDLKIGDAVNGLKAENYTVASDSRHIPVLGEVTFL